MDRFIRLLSGVTCVLAGVMGGSQVAEPNATAQGVPYYLVLIVLDGARPEYFTVSGTPHITALMDGGTQYTNAWAGILESETPSGHAAITTGSEPRYDGILGFSWANAANRPVSLFDPAKIRAGLMERYMREAGAPSIAGLLHEHDPEHDPTAKVVALSGSKYYAADALGGPDADVIMYFAPRSDHRGAPTAVPGHVPPAEVLSDPTLVATRRYLPLGGMDELAMRLADVTFRRLHQRVTLINLPEFDWPLGHLDGAVRDPADVVTLMRGFDRDLARIEDTYRQAGVLDRTLFVLTADHGFSPIDHTVSAEAISRAVQAAGTGLTWQTYHTAVFLWLQNKTRVRDAASNLARLRTPYIQAVYYRARPALSTYHRVTGPQRFHASGMERANQYLLRSFSSPSAPDLVIFFAEHTASLPDGEAGWKADHGGGSWEAQHIPLVFYGPGVVPGRISNHPARLIDIAPTALSLLGVSPEGMQGVPLADAMESPAPSLEAAQRAQARALRPLVRSLQEESRLERHRYQRVDSRPAAPPTVALDTPNGDKGPLNGK
jgi:hypothetical protein